MTCITTETSYIALSGLAGSTFISSNSEVWGGRETDAVPSTVGWPSQKLSSKIVHRPDLRSSRSVKDKFSLSWLPSDIENYFTKYCTGLGSKHIYEPGSFMKEHYDSRLPDVEKNGDTLKHIMTLIFTKDISPLKVGGKRLGVNTKSDTIYVILFPINLSHEVLPVTKTRVSFVFPVYGEYNPIAEISKLCLCDSKTPPKPIWENVKKFTLETKDCCAKDGCVGNGCVKDGCTGGCTGDVDFDCDSEEQDIDILFGYVKALKSDSLNLEFSNVIKARYDEGKETKSLADLCDLVLEEIELLEQQEKDSPKEFVLPSEYNFPNFPFTVGCTGRYFSDSKAPDCLNEIDRHFYNALEESKRKFVFTPVADVGIVESDKSFFFYLDAEGEIQKNLEQSPYSIVDELDVTFDDQGGYDPQYNLIFGMFIVE